jgi:hypothetical protein
VIEELKKSGHGIPEMDGAGDDDGDESKDTSAPQMIPMYCSVQEEIAEKKKAVRSKSARKKATKLYPKFMFIFDDLSMELKNKNVDFLLKTNRHYQSKVLVSTQWLTDLLPSSRRQMDYYILFKGLPPEKLEAVYKDADLHIDYETFLKLYETATAEMYSFLYIDVKNATFRRKFNTEIDIR